LPLRIQRRRTDGLWQAKTLVRWRWAAASEIGTSHLRLGTRKQDAMACFRAGENGRVLCALVCDGAGSAEHGGEGASVTCRTLSNALRQHFRQQLVLPDDDVVWTWIDLARDRLSVAAENRCKPRRAFASTLVMLAAAGDSLLTAHVGDGSVVGRDGTESWSTLSPPENGEYASMTFFVTDEPAPRLRISRFTGLYTAFAVFSDGIENFALDHRSNEPHEPFFRTMFGPLDDTVVEGRSAVLSTALSNFLTSPRVCEKTDDDKTLLLISSR